MTRIASDERVRVLPAATSAQSERERERVRTGSAGARGAGGTDARLGSGARRSRASSDAKVPPVCSVAERALTARTDGVGAAAGDEFVSDPATHENYVFLLQIGSRLQVIALGGTKAVIKGVRRGNQPLRGVGLGVEVLDLQVRHSGCHR